MKKNVDVGLTRRGMILGSAAGVGAMMLGSVARGAVEVPVSKVRVEVPAKGKVEAIVLGELPYGFAGLEPFVDARTMEIHFAKHHQGYVNAVNKIIAERPEFFVEGLEVLAENLEEVPSEVRVVLRNNLGGHLNHVVFWESMGPEGRRVELPEGALGAAVVREFGSVENLRVRVSEAALGVFGSGWAWVVLEKDGKLGVRRTANQDSPWMNGETPLLGIDVWEHAYYLKHQNRRADWVAAFWKVADWRRAGERFAAGIGKKS